MNEAPPVITGKADDATVFSVFRGWKASAEQQNLFNPWVEVEQARAIRDEAVRKFQAMVPTLAGPPRTARIGAAQVFIIRKLHARGWRRGMVENYLGLSLTPDVWRSMTS